MKYISQNLVQSHLSQIHPPEYGFDPWNDFSGYLASLKAKQGLDKIESESKNVSVSEQILNRKIPC